MARSETREIELLIFDKAKPALQVEYGNFEVDQTQTDRPDFAIILENGDRIGIEVTCYDNQNDLNYENFVPKDNSFDKDIERINDPDYSGKVNLLKSHDVFFKPLEIADRLVKNKGDKYKDYISLGFKEVILLAYSVHFSKNDKFKWGKLHLTILSDCFLIEERLANYNDKGEFSYDKVFFLSTNTDDDAFLLYKKGGSCMVKPVDNQREEVIKEALKNPLSTRSKQWEMAPVDRTITLSGLMDRTIEPIHPKPEELKK